jgi:hypothetical protein
MTPPLTFVERFFCGISGAGVEAMLGPETLGGGDDP